MLEVLRSGRLSLGPMGERFEREFAAWLGVEDAVAVSSGTTALHLGVRQLGWGEGDEVLTSPFSFVASANCLLYEGARPVFCDVDPVTLNLDPAAAAAAVGERTAGILPIHIFGYPAAMPRARGARRPATASAILEDACEALGAVDSEGRRVGARGNLATFAFYANKQMTTGEGGMIVPTDADAAARLRSERNQGRAVDMGWLDHDRLGFNYRLSDVAAALGVAQVEKLDALLGAPRRGRGALRRAAGRDRGGRGADRRPRRRSSAAGSSTSSPCPTRSTATRRSPASPSAASPPRPTCPASTSSRTCASSATARASSRSPKRPPPARWRCPSSRR